MTNLFNDNTNINNNYMNVNNNLNSNYTPTHAQEMKINNRSDSIEEKMNAYNNINVFEGNNMQYKNNTNYINQNQQQMESNKN